MRLFFAVEISAQVREAISELQKELRPRLRSARWVPAANVHLTLRFLGECEPRVVSELHEALVDRVGALEPFKVRFRGVGAFPSTKKPRVLWVGVDEPDPVLVRLQSTVEEEVRCHGFAPEKRSFQPHLTVARFKRPDRELQKLTPPLSNRDFGPTNVSELVLFESRLARDGATYHVAERFSLGGTEREQLV